MGFDKNSRICSIFRLLSAIGHLSLLESLAQTPLLKDCLDRTGGGKAFALTGVSPHAQPALIAALCTQNDRLPSSICVLTSSVREQEYFVSELSALLESEGVPRRILLYPEVTDFNDAFLDDSLALLDSDTQAERLSILSDLSSPRHSDIPQVIVTTAKAFMQDAPAPAHLRGKLLSLKVGQSTDQQSLFESLQKAGYENTSKVSHSGQIARRGGILDIFAYSSGFPVRLEFFGDEIESIRAFDPDSQISQSKLPGLDLSLSTFRMPGGSGESTHDGSCLMDYFSPGTLLVFAQPPTLAQLAPLHEAATQKPAQFARLLLASEPVLDDTAEHSDFVSGEEGFHFFDNDFLLDAGGDDLLMERRRETFLQTLAGWLKEEWKVHIYGNNEGELERLREILEEARIFPATPGNLLRMSVAAVLSGV